jgi:hypothetical protein
MLKFKKGGYARHDSGTVYKVKDISPNPYNPQVLLVSLVTGKRTYTRAIQTDKLGNEFAQCGQRVIELEGHKCNIVRDIRTDENGEEYILDEVKLTGGVVEEVRIVPVGNKFTLEGD